MKLKKFYADNMQEALRIIKEEVGPDAVILSSKYVRSRKGLLGLFSKKRLEVVAGYEEKLSSSMNLSSKNDTKFSPLHNAVATKEQEMPFKRTSSHVPRNSQEESQNSEKIEKLDASIEQLKEMIGSLSGRIEGQSMGVQKQFTGELRDLHRRLLENDVEQGLATELCQKVEDVLSVRDVDPKEVLTSFILDMLEDTKPLQTTKFKRKVVMLIGPTGVGKTTTLIKLAAKYLYEEKLNIGVINADVFRVAAKEHLKAYCDILNTDMLTIYRPSEIVDALEAFKDKDMVFIDTAGKLSSNEEYQDEIKKIIELGNIEDIYLLVSASTSEKIIKKILRDYSFLKNHNIIVTKMDETSSQGVLLYIATESGRPLSYLTNGQNVPDDIIEVSPNEVASAILENDG